VLLLAGVLWSLLLHKWACFPKNLRVSQGKPISLTSWCHGEREIRRVPIFPFPVPGSTCCCQTEFFGYCFTWACCPLANAICCDDHEHCCPTDLPVCDTTAGRCLKKEGAVGAKDSSEWHTKTPAIKTGEQVGFCPCGLYSFLSWVCQIGLQSSLQERRRKGGGGALSKRDEAINILPS